MLDPPIVKNHKPNKTVDANAIASSPDAHVCARNSSSNPSRRTCPTCNVRMPLSRALSDRVCVPRMPSRYWSGAMRMSCCRVPFIIWRMGISMMTKVVVVVVVVVDMPRCWIGKTSHSFRAFKIPNSALSLPIRVCMIILLCMPPMTFCRLRDIPRRKSLGGTVDSYKGPRQTRPRWRRYARPWRLGKM